MQNFATVPRSAGAPAVWHSHACIPQPAVQAVSAVCPAETHPSAATGSSPFSLPPALRAQIPAKLRSGIPRVDRFFDDCFFSGQLVLLEGPADFVLQLTTRFAVSGVLNYERPVLFVDGGNTADPYGLAAVCRRWHVDAQQVLKQIFIARAFTVYQLDTLLAQMVEERVSALGPAVIIISSLNSMYLDPDVGWDEARGIFENDMARLRELTESYGVITLITNHGRHKSYHSLELRRKLRSLTALQIDIRTKSRNVLHIVKNGAKSMDFRPLPPYQCSLDEYFPGGGIADG